MPQTHTYCDNGLLTAKCDLRRELIAHLNAPDLHVLDCCAGSGDIWRDLRKNHPVTSYLGMDQKRIEGVMKMNSVRFLAQPGWKANLVDIDTYGSPWAHWEAMLATMPEGERIAVALCVGVIKNGVQRVTATTRRLLGLDGLAPMMPQSIQNEVEDRYGVRANLSNATAFGVEISFAVEAINPGSGGRWGGNARYIGVILCKTKPIKPQLPTSETPTMSISDAPPNGEIHS